MNSSTGESRYSQKTMMASVNVLDLGNAVKVERALKMAESGIRCLLYDVQLISS